MELTAEEVLIDELVVTWLYTDELTKDWRKALHQIIDWHVQVALDPQVSEEPTEIIRNFMSQHTSSNVDRMSIEDMHEELDYLIKY
jgi:hypothetical protein